MSNASFKLLPAVRDLHVSRIRRDSTEIKSVTARRINQASRMQGMLDKLPVRSDAIRPEHCERFIGESGQMVCCTRLNALELTKVYGHLDPC